MSEFGSWAKLSVHEKNEVSKRRWDFFESSYRYLIHRLLTTHPKSEEKPFTTLPYLHKDFQSIHFHSKKNPQMQKLLTFFLILKWYAYKIICSLIYIS